MAKIENPKNYTGRDLETIFFRPMLSGPGAQDLGIKVMYNTPVPTTLQFWKRAGDILQTYSSNGWNGGSSSTKFQKTINLSKVKAEMGYSAEDYFNMVFELITASSEVNFDDLTGTELEKAETSLFRSAIAESIRATMWLGDKNRQGSFNTFDGFLKQLFADSGTGNNDVKCTASGVNIAASSDPEAAESILKNLWDSSSDMLKEFKSQGNLVYLVTSDIYAKYEEELDGVALESAYLSKQNGRNGLTYRGIPVIDIRVSSYLKDITDMPSSFAILTDSRNLALAVNTSDFPGTEIRMWYNPDEMENRQRAVFMAGCDYLLPELINMTVCAPKVQSASGKKIETSGAIKLIIDGYSFIESVQAIGLNASGAEIGMEETLTFSNGTYSGIINNTSVKIKLSIVYRNGQSCNVIF